MKLLLLLPLCAWMLGASTPPPPKDATGYRDEYRQTMDYIEKNEKPRLDAALKAYAAQLDALSRALAQAGKRGESAAVQEEAANLRKRKIPSEPLELVPEWKLARSDYEKSVRAARQGFMTDITRMRKDYFDGLNDLEIKVLLKPGAYANSAELLKQIKGLEICLAIERQMDDGVRISAGAPQFVEMPPHGSLLLGFKAGAGTYAGKPVVGALQPVFLTDRGETPGYPYGKAELTETLIAPKGYAVGGIFTRGNGRVEGICMEFYKIKPSGFALDPDDRQTSAWFGGGEGTPQVELGGDGKPVVGIAAKSGWDVEEIGVVQLR